MRPIVDEAIETDCDWPKMRDRLFVIPSFAYLRSDVESLVARMGIDVG